MIGYNVFLSAVFLCDNCLSLSSYAVLQPATAVMSIRSLREEISLEGLFKGICVRILSFLL